MKRCSSSVSKTKLYAANQITPTSYLLQFELFKPKAQIQPVNQLEQFNNGNGTGSNTGTNVVEHKLIANKSYVSRKGGDLYTRTRNCLYHNSKGSGTGTNTDTSFNLFNSNQHFNKSIPRKSNLDKLMLSLKNEIYELSKNIETTPPKVTGIGMTSTVTNSNQVYDLQAKTLLQQRSFSYKSRTKPNNDKLENIRAAIDENETNYFEKKLEILNQKRRENKINSNNTKTNNNSNANERYLEDLHSQKVMINFNSTFNPTNNIIAPSIIKDIAIPLKLQNSYEQNNHNNNNPNNISEISSVCFQREDNADIKLLNEKNKCLEQLVSSLEAKAITSNHTISELINKITNYEIKIRDLTIDNKYLQEMNNNNKERAQEEYSIQPYSSTLIQKENQKQSEFDREVMYKEKINELTKDNNKLNDMIEKNTASYTENMNKIKVNNDKYIKENNEKDDIIIKYKEELAKVTIERNKVKDEMNALKYDTETKLNDIQLVLISKEREIQSIKKDAQAKKNINLLEEQLRIATDEKENALILIKQTENNYNKTIDKLTRENSELIAQMNQLKVEAQDKETNEQSILNDQIATFKEENEQLKHEKTSQLDIINQNKEIIKSFTKEIEKNKTELSKLQMSNDKLVLNNQTTIDSIINEHNIKYSDLQREYESLSNQYKDKIKEHDQTVSALNKEISNCKSKLEESNKLLLLKENEHSQQIEEYKTIISNNEKETNNLNKQMLILKESIDKSNKDLRDKENELSELKNKMISSPEKEDQSKENELLQKQLSEVKSSFDEYKQKYSINQKEIDTIKEISNKQSQKIELMTKEEQVNSASLLQLKEENKLLLQSNEEMKLQIEELKKKSKEDIDAISSDFHNQILQYKTQCEEKNNIEKLTNDELITLQDQSSKLKKDKEDMNNQLIVVSEELNKQIIINQSLQREKEDLVINVDKNKEKENKLQLKIQDLMTDMKRSGEDKEKLIQDLTHQIKEKDNLINEMHSTLVNLSKENDSLNQKLLPISSDELLDLSIFQSNQDIEEINSLYQTLSQCKDTISTLESMIKEKDNEIEQFKAINHKLLLSLETEKQITNTKVKHQHKEEEEEAEGDNNEGIIDSELVENLQMTIDNLRELVQEKEKQISELLSTHKDTSLERLYTKNSVMSLADTEKCEQYQKRIEDYKFQIQSEIQQNSLLKQEIKELNRKILIIQSFEGKITNYEDFLQLWVVLFDNYKPKGAEKKEAYSRILQHLTGYDAIVYNEYEKESEEKKGILSKIFK